MIANDAISELDPRVVETASVDWLVLVLVLVLVLIAVDDPGVVSDGSVTAGSSLFNHASMSLKFAAIQTMFCSTVADNAVTSSTVK